MFQRQTEYCSPEEYLALEEKADYKSEYYNGEIFAMAGGSYNHNVIAGNLYAALNQFVESKACTAFTSDMRLLVEEAELYTYPDVMVVCGRPQFVKNRIDTITNPIVIVEVLSRSTRGYDRGQKFEFYRTIETFEDYVLIDQDRVQIEYFHKLADGRWILAVFNTLEATLTIESIDFEIPLSRIYHKVDWSAT
jgi:Uma2 family endonuclease